MKFGHMTCGGEALGAAPTPRKRGPWRPPRMGRQGRLPFWTASLRRAILVYHFPCMNIVDAEFQNLGNST